MKILEKGICKFGIKFVTDEGVYVFGKARFGNKVKGAWATEDGKLLLDAVKESKLRWAIREFEENED